LALSPEVIAALDGRTDHPLYAAKHEEGDQIDTRLMTRSGAVLACKQYLVGYSRMSMANLPGGRWAFRHLAYGPELARLTLRPIPEPSVADAVGFRVACSNPDFLLPGGKPARFDISAVNYARSRQRVPIAFQVCDYLTRQKIAESETTCDLQPAQELEVPHQASLSQPGPYRARLVIDDRQGHERAIEWVFTYDFPNYRPPLTRQPDFQQFWKDTLDELAKIPMDAKVTPAPEQSDATAEAFRVSLATLGGRRVWCWYWKPRKPGCYPVQFQLPSSGVYPFQAMNVPHGAELCGMWMAIHGLPVDFDPQKPPQDLAALNYWTHGISSPKTSMWRTIYASMVRGLDFLCSREEVDAKRIMVAGGSQGGGLSMVLAGLDRRVALAAPAHRPAPARLDRAPRPGLLAVRHGRQAVGPIDGTVPSHAILLRRGQLHARHSMSRGGRSEPAGYGHRQRQPDLRLGPRQAGPPAIDLRSMDQPRLGLARGIAACRSHRPLAEEMKKA
jgi:hypothetical protein